MLGSDLAEQIRAERGHALGRADDEIAAEIEEDRETLIDLMERLDVQESRQAGHDVGGREGEPVKFSGRPRESPSYGTFMALETLTLGVEGKASLWKALKAVADRYEPLQSTNLDDSARPRRSTMRWRVSASQRPSARCAARVPRVAPGAPVSGGRGRQCTNGDVLAPTHSSRRHPSE